MICQFKDNSNSFAKLQKISKNMKATSIIAFAAVCMAACVFSCKNKGQQATDSSKLTADYVKQRVEKMMTINPVTDRDWPNLFTARLISIYNRVRKAEENAPAGYMDFNWTGKVFDVCCEDSTKRVVSLKDVRLTDSRLAEADLNYVDPPCYNIDYTLILAFDGDEWYIDDIIWKRNPALEDSEDTLESQEAEGFIEEQKENNQ